MSEPEEGIVSKMASSHGDALCFLEGRQTRRRSAYKAEKRGWVGGGRRQREEKA